MHIIHNLLKKTKKINRKTRNKAIRTNEIIEETVKKSTSLLKRMKQYHIAYLCARSDSLSVFELNAQRKRDTTTDTLKVVAKGELTDQRPLKY